MGRLIHSFRSDRRGNISILTAAMIVPMMLMAGGAVDLVRHESLRAELQDALDRGVLAAASLSQTRPSRETVEGYLKSLPASQTYSLTVDETVALNSKNVTATAETSFDTAFLHFAGMKNLVVRAKASAEESRQKVELSLMLDISGSMYDNGGLVQLKPAAKSFIDAILKEDVRNVTSVSLIPYAGQVNVGKTAFGILNGSLNDPNAGYVRKHDNSSCYELNDADFGAVQPDFKNRSQVVHFTYYNYKTNGKEPWWCPTDDAAISYLSNDPVALKAKIDKLKPFDGTGTAYGTKWGALLLDPASNGTVKKLAGANLVPAAFADRPAPYGDTETRKFMVLMTDGQISFQPRPKDDSLVYFYEKTDAKNFKEIFTTSKAQTQLTKLCDLAKANGVTVFTIGFKLSDSIAATLAKCATSPSHAYRADGLDIAKAFQSIATAIQKIKLTT